MTRPRSGRSSSARAYSSTTARTLTADDVVYSLNRHKDPAVASKAKALAEQMTEIVATGPQEVKITLAGPNADLPVMLGTYHFLIVKDGTTDFTTAHRHRPLHVQGVHAGRALRSPCATGITGSRGRTLARRDRVLRHSG